MSRTINGNLTGRAARRTLDDTPTPTARDAALTEIHERMGGNFHDWYDETYKFRKAGRMAEYEQEITVKLMQLKRDEHELFSDAWIADNMKITDYVCGG